MAMTTLDAMLRAAYLPAVERVVTTWPTFLPMPADPNPFPRMRLWR